MPKHQVVIIDLGGRGFTRFRVAHSCVGISELLRRRRSTSPQTGGRIFAFEANGHVWEALAARLEEADERCVGREPARGLRPA